MEDKSSEAPGSLPPGFRFNPTDRELLTHYLEPKTQGKSGKHDIIPVIEACKLKPDRFERWPAEYGHKFNSKKPFYFCRLEKYKRYKSECYDRKTTADDGKTNANADDGKTTADDGGTIDGHWKVTSKDRDIMSKGTKEKIGFIKKLVFHPTNSDNKESSDWVCDEYHLNHNKYKMSEPYVICRIKKKKEKKPITAHAPAISPVGCSSRPHASTSNVSGTPVNQEGDHSSFRNTLSSGVAGNQEAVNAQPETSAEDALAYDNLANSAGDGSLFVAGILYDDRGMRSLDSDSANHHTSTDHYNLGSPSTPGWESGTMPEL